MSQASSYIFTVAIAAGLAATTSFAEAKPKKTPAPTPPLLAQACAGCHGQVGAGENGTPTLAAYDKTAFARVWDEFRNNQRPAASIMPRIARGYTEAEVATLAEYFSSVRR
jgi:sulfide dehydrogenase cytochrome subunit